MTLSGTSARYSKELTARMNFSFDSEAVSGIEIERIAPRIFPNLIAERQRIESEYGTGITFLVRRYLVSANDHLIESVVDEIINRVIVDAQRSASLPALCRRIIREVCMLKKSQLVESGDETPVNPQEIAAAKATLRILPARAREALQLWSEGASDQEICRRLMMTPQALRTWKVVVRWQFENAMLGYANALTSAWVHRVHFVFLFVFESLTRRQGKIPAEATRPFVQLDGPICGIKSQIGRESEEISDDSHLGVPYNCGKA